MLFELTSSPQLSVLMLVGLVVGCWFVWDLAQAVAEIIIEQWASLGRTMDKIDAALALPIYPSHDVARR